MENDILEEGILFDKEKPKFLLRPFIVWGSLLIIGIVFKILHWPGGIFLTTVCSAGLHAYCFSGFLNKQKRNTLNLLGSTIGFLWVIFVTVMVVGGTYHENGLITYSLVFSGYTAFYSLLWKNR